MINQSNALFALGLAQKAGKLASGDYAVKSAIKTGKTRLLLVAADAAENSKKDLYILAELYGVMLVETLSRDQLGQAIGKARRTAVAILDDNFAKMVRKAILPNYKLGGG